MADAVPEKPVNDVKPEGGAAPPLPPKPPVPANDSTPAAAPVPAPAPAVEPKAAAPISNTAPAIAAGNETKPAPQPAEDKKKQSGFEKLLRLISFGDIVDASRQPRQKSHHIAQAVFNKIGFGEIYKAAKQPKGKLRAIGAAIGKKATDMVAGRIVSTSFRLIAITLVAGMIGGVTGWGSICLLALATGTSSAIYTYGKEYVTDKLSTPKAERKKVKIIDRTRAESAGKAFLSGTFNGAFGAWLATLPLFQAAMEYIRGTIHHGIGEISKPFNDAAATKASSLRLGIASQFSAAAQVLGLQAASPPQAPAMLPGRRALRPSFA